MLCLRASHGPRSYLIMSSCLLVRDGDRWEPPSIPSAQGSALGLQLASNPALSSAFACSSISLRHHELS